jgi:hypothetical protein
MINYLKFRKKLADLRIDVQESIRDLKYEFDEKYKIYNKELEDVLRLRAANPDNYFSEPSKDNLDVINSAISYQESRESLLWTAYFRNLAEKYKVPLPSEDDEKLWESVYVPLEYKSVRFLNTDGIYKIRADIRKERKDSFDLIQGRIALVLGMIGTITGLSSCYISVSKIDGIPQVIASPSSQNVPRQAQGSPSKP